MTISGISSNLAPLVQSALDINKQLDDLQRQLGSGQKADTYAGLGPQSGVTVALNAQLSALSGFDDTITNVGTTVSLQQLVLQQIATLGNTAKTATLQPNYTIDSTGQTTAQKTATDQLDQILSLAEYPRRQRLHVLGKRVGPAVGRHRRSYSQRQWRPGRPQTGYRRAQSGGPRSRRARPPGHSGGRRQHRIGPRGRRRLACSGSSSPASVRRSPARR